MLLPLTLSMSVGLLICAYIIMRLANALMWVREELQCATDIDHAKCIGAVAAFVGNEFAAQVLEIAAADYDAVDEKTRLARIVNTRYRAGGPSVPTLWMQDRAERLRILSDHPDTDEEEES